MAVVYILYSEKLDSYCTGSCNDLVKRIKEHLNKDYSDSYTTRANDWIIYYSIDQLEYQQARKIEKHIKQMKSKKYIQNLKKYPELTQKLITKYS